MDLFYIGAASLNLPSIMAWASTIILGMLFLFCMIFITFIRADKRVIWFSLLVLATLTYTLGFAVYTNTGCTHLVFRWKIIRYAAITLTPLFFSTFADQVMYGRSTNKWKVYFSIDLILFLLIVLDHEHFITNKVVFIPERGYYTALAGPWMKFYFIAMISMYASILAALVRNCKTCKRSHPLILLSMMYVFNGIYDLCVGLKVVRKFYPILWLGPEIIVLTVAVFASIELKKHHIQFENICCENKQLTDRVIRDDLTGLYTKEHLFNYIETHKKELQGSSLIVMDMDKFKMVNDTLGHDQGDKLLVCLSIIIHRNLTSNDIAARFGGDEFFILLKDASVSKANIIGERIRNQYLNVVRMQNMDMYYKGHDVSVGVTAFDERDQDVLSVFRRADKDMYMTKRKKKIHMS